MGGVSMRLELTSLEGRNCHSSSSALRSIASGTEGLGEGENELKISYLLSVSGVVELFATHTFERKGKPGVQKI